MKHIETTKAYKTMRNLWMAAAFMCSAVAFTSCDSNTRDTDTTDTVATGEPVVAPVDSTLTDEKREFMSYAHSISSQQVELGKIAVERGRTTQVREYGQQMVDLYTKKLEELRDMSGQYSVTLPQSMAEEQAGRVQELRDKEAKEFDRAYWDTVIEAHKDALNEFDDNIKDLEETDNTTFNLWARNSAKEIRAQMENAMRFRLDLKN
jgi:putative membrane protein